MKKSMNQILFNKKETVIVTPTPEDLLNEPVNPDVLFGMLANFENPCYNRKSEI